jgi:hypothetical protein
MSDGGRERAWLGVEVWKSSQKRSVRRSAVRSIVWLGLFGFKLFVAYDEQNDKSGQKREELPKR